MKPVQTLEFVETPQAVDVQLPGPGCTASVHVSTSGSCTAPHPAQGSHVLTISCSPFETTASDAEADTHAPVCGWAYMATMRSIAGKPLYMAPEIYSASLDETDIDSAAKVDIYSLGILMYRLASGISVGDTMAQRAAIAGLILLPTIGGHVLAMFLLKYVKSQMATLSIPTQFIIGTVLAMFLFGEQPRPGFWFGAVLILTGVVLGILPVRNAPAK